MEYQEFLKTKQLKVESSGFDVDISELHPSLFDFQKDIVKWSLKKGKAAIFAGTGLGKCHGKGTKILMYDGSIKNVEDVNVGDQLVGPDSKPRNVLSLARGIDSMYRIIPIKGDSFICNSEHILSLKMSAPYTKYHRNQIVNISINDYFKQTDKFKHLAKLWRTGVEHDYKHIQYDPYLVGVWLGDGTKQSPSITNSDFEIVNEIKKFALRHDLNIIETDVHNTTTYYLSNGRCNNQYGKSNALSNIARMCILNNEKRIPKEYLVNSRDIRLELLAGLIDTDGYNIDNVFEICTKYNGLKDDILYLARSLGFAAYSNIRKADIKSIGFTGYYHRIHISGNTHLIPCKVSRRIASERKQIKNVLHTGFDIEAVGVDEYYGFELDGDHLYLLGDFTVTHNTYMQLEWANKVCEYTNGNVLILAPLAVSQQTVHEGVKFGITVHLCRQQSDVKDGINITNYEMLHKFDIDSFVGIVLDESSILKSFTGKVRTQLIEDFQEIPYRLACTATPAPNDYMELGNHSEFLGVMSVVEMFAMFFVHDGGETSKWRLKGHAVKEFWEWISSWAVMLSNPRDLGYDGEMFDLPELRIHEVQVDKTGYVVKLAQTLTERRDARRSTIDARVKHAADIVFSSV